MNSLDQSELSKVVEHLFRREAGSITSVLTRIFGIENMELAEDVVQDTLLKALQIWPFKGIPDNPSAWLYRTAKNKAIDLLRRKKLNEKYSEEISTLFNSEWTLSGKVKEFFSENEIKDDQLRMIFTCCHPELPAESQVALALKNLCGFSIKEIAKSFLTNEAVITKRLSRAKDKIREDIIKFEIPAGDELEARLKNVLSAIYLLFNEGYNSSNYDILIREDLIEEAIRLTGLLIDHHLTAKPEVHALMALILFHYARTPARIDDKGNILLLKEQDRSLWNKKLISKGIKYLEKSAYGDKLTEYHLQAGIAYFYSTSENFESTDWEKILKLYDLLYEIDDSAIVGLNRAIVYAQLYSVEAGLCEIKKLSDRDLLENYYLYHSTLGELYFQNGDYSEARKNFEKAILMTESEAEKKLIRKKLGKMK